MASPTCQVKEGAGAYQSTTNGVDVSPGSAITIKLADVSGVVTWTITCLTTDELSSASAINSSMTIDSVNKTASFTYPSAAGRCLRFRSSVLDGAGVTSSTTFCIYSLTSQGNRCGALDETTEGGQNGWMPRINALIRSGGSGGGSTPTGTGFRHVTSGVEDAAAKLVDTADVNDNQITNAKLRDSGACSVIGRASNSSGDPADISATTNNTVLKRSGDALSFATIVNADVDAAAAIAGTKISPDFGSQSIITTGNLLLGATPRASAGLIRLPKGFILAARNNADSNNNYALEDDGATDTLYVGGNASRYAYTFVQGSNQWIGTYGPRVSEATGNTTWQPWTDINIQAGSGGDPSTNPSTGFRLFGKASTHQASVRGKGGAQTMLASSGTGTVNSQSTWLKRERGFLRTTDATANQVICSLSIPSGFGGVATITMVSRNASTGAVASTRIVHTVKNVGGTSSSVGNTTYHSHTTDLAVSYSVNINDTNDTIEARVTGIAGTTIDHTAEIEFIEN